MISRRSFGIYCSIPGLIALAALIFYPVAYNVYVSILRYDHIFPVVFNGLENYRWLFSSSDFYHSWRISAIYSVSTTALTLAFGLILAHSLHKITKGRTVFRTLVILPWAAPLVISGLMWRWMFSKDMGVINYLLFLLGVSDKNIGFLLKPNLAMISGVFTTAWCYIPFMTVLLSAGLESIPPELYEVAQIDGADSLQRFRHISLALNKPQILIASLIIWMFTFRTPDVFVSLTRGGPGKYTYHAGLFLRDVIFKFLNFGHGGAISVVLALTILIPAIPVLFYMRGSK